ncbi:hypothetical protein B0H63DRAFT_464781 [Podospora didyma]|uniref:N-acetyltransferase domain-containing protein n=1 Tax=Podospora didyma TaxID=330526 RepID=A0AAE0U3Y2_9PEZI|nr:hypothetical protein B0H63DRAFT_464781 [Podospora didyma]
MPHPRLSPSLIFLFSLFCPSFSLFSISFAPLVGNQLRLAVAFGAAANMTATNMIREPRLGLPTDVDALTQVIIQTMPLDPQWNYRFPPALRQKYPDDHRKYTRMLFEYFLDQSYTDWCVMVVEDSLEPGGSDTAIVSFGVWDVSFLNKRRYGPKYRAQDPVTDVENNGGSTRKDANHEHFNQFWKGQIRAYKRYFAPIGPEQMHLQVLATHPDYQRRGHATSLCNWAIERVREERLKDMSVMASPMGYGLYTKLGFETVATFPIQVPGEEEKLTLVAMMYTPSQIQEFVLSEEDDTD